MKHKIYIIGSHSDIRCKQIINVVEKLIQNYLNIIECSHLDISYTEDLDKLSIKQFVSCIPAVTILFNSGKHYETLELPKISILSSKIKSFILAVTQNEEFIDIKRIIQDNKLVLFMKGSKENPFCRFSKQALNILRQYETEILTVDVLNNDKLRSQMKEFSQWPTFPQIYIKEHFIGGVDILQTLHDSGELQKILRNE